MNCPFCSSELTPILENELALGFYDTNPGHLRTLADYPKSSQN